jgi:hypothetical protein
MARAQAAAAKAPPKTAEFGAPPASGAKLSPLELARQQGALKAGGAVSAPKPAAPAKAENAPAAAPAQPTGKKMSPLEIARAQGAAKEGCLTSPAAPAPTPVAGAAAPTPPTAAPPAAAPASAPAPAGGKKLSPLEQARQQGAFKGGKG